MGDNTVYLCQVSPNVSCGACCGLYNVSDPSPAALEAMLMRRTHWFADVPRTVVGIDEFKAGVERAESQDRPFKEFHHCPFLGMITDAGRRVGCLLHPLAEGNDGLDWRGLSYYGGMACRTYFCPSVRRLPRRWLTALHQSMDHWYLHGLIVTERRLIEAFFQTFENRIGRQIDASDFSDPQNAARLRSAFRTLKLAWPFRRTDASGICNYFFEDGRYPRPHLSASTRRFSDAPLNRIFQELDSGFSFEAERRSAEAWVEQILRRIEEKFFRR